MQFKKFVAADMREALSAVKLELGPDAVIVSTRQLGGGLFKKRQLEVTAAVEEPSMPRLFNEPPKSSPMPGSNPAYQQASAPPPQQPAASIAPTGGSVGVDAGLLDLKLDPLRRELRALRNAMRSGNERADASQEIRQELTSLREMFSNMWAQREKTTPNDPLLDILIAADVDAALARDLVQQVTAQRDRSIQDPQMALDDGIALLKQNITDMMRIDESFFAIDEQRRVALVGPTGVGKTLTIAKIADAALAHDKRVALVGADSYRIASFEQMSHYASILDVPLAMARDPDSFASALRSFQDVDLVLIDTAGRSPNDENFVTELKDLFEGHEVHPYLTLAATTRSLELQSIIKSFMPLQPESLVFTKLDETQALGALLNAAVRCSIPMAFLSIGQQVPGDLAIADSAELAERLIGMVLESTNFAWLSQSPQEDSQLLWAAQGDTNAH